MSHNNKTDDQLAAQHITSFIDAFIIKNRRGTYSRLLANTIKRRKALDRLNHKILKDLDSNLVHSHPPEKIDWQSQAYIFSDSSTIDGNLSPVAHAIAMMESSCFGTVVSIKAGKLAAIKTESPSKTIWLY